MKLAEFKKLAQKDPKYWDLPEKQPEIVDRVGGREFYIRSEVQFCAAHRLHHHKGECSFLHGHNFKIEAIAGFYETDPKTGMCVDFKVLKKVVETSVVDYLDHATIASYADSDLIKYLGKGSQRFVVVCGEPTAELLAELCWERIVNQLTFELTFQQESNAVRLKSLTIRVYETEKYYAEFRGYGP